jgi:hypothetical protein
MVRLTCDIPASDRRRRPGNKEEKNNDATMMT